MAEKPRIQLFTPASRIVTGNVQKPNLTDMHGKPRSSPQYFFGVAFPKTHPDAPAMFTAMHDFAMAQYAYYDDVKRRIGMLWTHGPKCGFAYKFEDGDVPHPQKGIRPGYAGCWVMKFTSTFPIRCCNEHDQAISPDQVLTGYLVDVAFNVTINQKTDHTAGLFLNPVFVRLLSQAQVIVGGPQASQVFAQRQAPKHELGNFREAMQPQQGMPGSGGAGGVPGGAGGMAPHQSQAGGGSGAFSSPGYTQGAYGGAPAPQNQHQAPAMGNGGVSHAPSNQMYPGGAAPNPGGQMQGGQGAGNPQHTMPSLPGSPPSTAAMNAGGMSGSSGTPAGATASPSDMGNVHANAPAVPGGASPVHAPSTAPGQGSPIASPSNYQPHPGFVHGGGQAA